MSEDTEKKVLEETRRNHSDIHAVTGNINKRKLSTNRGYGEFEVKSPIKAIAIIGGTFVAFVGAVYLLDFIVSLF